MLKRELKTIATFFGKKDQTIKTIEEMGELTQALSKDLIKPGTNRANIIEEIADVEIMLEQIMYLFDIDSYWVSKVKFEKIKRTLKYIETIKKTPKGGDNHE